MTRFAVLLALSAATIAAAEEKPKINTLTPQEIADGWILLFDGETTFGWKIEGDTTIANGVWTLGGKQPTSAATTSKFQAFQLKFEINANAAKGATLSALAQSRTGLGGIAKSGWVRSQFDAIPDGKGEIRCEFNQKEGSGTESWSKQISLGMNPEPTPIQFTVPADATIAVRSVKLRPLALQPLFNGKDLTGWKVFDDPKRNQSKWSVTKEGWLNVKNGPGDLQTEKKFDDFVLQLECMSNGEALNSGLFFRCIENEYQNGYEMQVQNAYKDGDRTKPADFGTGAIYRRIPARKVVSNDKEWFAMTLVATGNHIATWVNGYQTVDWTDDRPADNNPRKGSKTGAGHLSIQGHDPTTDLIFRNIRVGALPAKKADAP